MKILLSGFEPFGEHTRNPSQDLVLRLPQVLDGGVTILKTILPVDHIQAPQILLEEIAKHQPHAVLSFGLASGRARIGLERVALNLKDFRIADNAGVIIQDQPIFEDGPTAYFSSLPLRKMHTALQSAGIPSEISLSAGAYLCNQIFYVMMHEIEQKNLPTRAGFIHLPALPEQAAKADNALPSLSMEIVIRATHILISQLHQGQSAEPRHIDPE
jgi:pyroglutamyl-peptidase